MSTHGRHFRWRLAPAALAAVLLVLAVLAVPAMAAGYTTISGTGSSWAFNAIDQFRKDVKQYGITVNYSPDGSSAGRQAFLDGTVDFAASDIPFQANPEDGSVPERPTPGSYAYMPITAGGTVFMYNLKINGQQVTNLRLSGTNVTKIFTGVITNWSDPALAADNPGLTLPNRSIVPVVRSDGSGSTAQFSLWMISQHRDLWDALCNRVKGGKGCGETSYYPTSSGMIAQSGDLGVAGYVAQSYADGAIGYVNYSYALNEGFPVAKMLNSAGYYTEPTPENVAVSLLQARINNDPASPDYLTQQLDGVYTDPDPRTYPLSSYSYLILPTTIQGRFDADKGRTLAAFSYYAMCQGQQQSGPLGYSPMPINLVKASFDQIRKIPGAEVQNIDVSKCNNPTFSPDGHNVLADTAPQPQACDHQGPTQCATGTGGAKSHPTPVKATAAAGGATPGSSNHAANNNTGTAGGRAGTVAGSPVSTVAGAATDQTCNPDTAACPVAASDGRPSAAQLASGTPLTVKGPSGWTSTQTLMVIAALLLVGLVLAPGVAAEVLERRRPH